MTSSIIKSQNIQVGKFTLSPYGLGASGKPTYDEWVECGDWIKRVEGAVQWWRGDWSNFGEQAFGDKYAQEIDKFGIDYSTMANERYVAKEFDFSRRRENLSWSHHREVAPLEPSDQDELLDVASDKGWNRAELRDEVRRRKVQKRIVAQASQNGHASDALTILTGDCREVLAELTQVFDLMIADPPYNVKEVDWDMIGTREQYIEFMRDWISAAMPRMAPDYHAFIFCSPVYMADIEILLRELYLPIQSRIIWHHKNMAMGRAPESKLISSWEPIFHVGTTNLHLPQAWGSERFDVQEEAAPQTNYNDTKVHQTQKPIKLIEWLVTIGSAAGQWVLDPFAGGGTTAMACKSLKRPCVSIEKSAAFVEVIRERVGGMD